MTQISTATVKNVGAGGDFATINDAIAYFSDCYPIYAKGGINVEIHLLTGFVMAEQVLVSGLDLSWIKITAADTEVLVDSSALTTSFHNFHPLFGADNGGSLPIIGALFSYTGTVTTTDKHGVFVVGAGTSAIVANACGVKNAHGHGMFAEMGAVINAEWSKFSGAKVNGAYALCVASIDAGSADLSGAASYGLYAVGGSRINAGSTNVSGCYIGAYATESSVINCAALIADACTYNGIYCIRDSHICAHGAYIRNQTVGNCCVSAYAGSFVDALSIVTTGSTVPVFGSTPNTLTSNGAIFN